MKRLRDRMLEDLEVRGLRPNTRASYLRFVEKFTSHFDQPPAKLGADHIRQFVLYLSRERQLCARSINVCLAAITFFYCVTLRRPDVVAGMCRVKCARPLPTVLSTSEVQALLSAVRWLKHRAILMLAYGAGLRVSEICTLQVQDIDAKRMLIHIRDSKGGRDRYVMLSPMLLQALRAYAKKCKIRGPWVFPSRKPGRDVVTRTNLHKMIKSAAKRAGITKRVSMHTLRHSFATHLLESGMDLRTLQILLGHARISTTTTYLHVAASRVQSLGSPLDQLKLD